MMTGSGHLLGLWIFLLVSSLQYSAGQDTNCNFLQNVTVGTTYSVRSPNYPNNYGPSKICRWQATCPINTNCRLNCQIVNIPATTNCSGDKLLVSKIGDATLKGSEIYCGRGSINVLSTSNKLSVGFVSSASSIGGIFGCTLTAQSITGGATKCSCGWRKRFNNNRNEYPMIAGLVDITRKILFCGATIISREFVLSAAHCLQNAVVANVRVVVGHLEINPGIAITGSQSIRAAQFIKHPSYTGSGLDYDIGLVKTAESILYSYSVSPACLPFSQTQKTFVDSYVEAFGRNTTASEEDDHNCHSRVSLQVIDKDTCAAATGFEINQRIMCTYMSDEGASLLQYDSGNPILWENSSNKKLYVVGIMIGGHGLGITRPGVNTRVSEHLVWIVKNAVGASFCST